MAWSAVTSRGSATSGTSSTTIAMSPSAAIAVDKIALVWCSADNIATADGASSNHSISDTDGHTWTKLKEWTRSAGAAADGITISLYAVKVTSEIGTGDTITITFTSAITEKVMGVGEATVAAGQTFELEPSSDAGAQGSSSTPSVSNSGLTSQEYLFIGLMGRETASTITQDADYTTLQLVGSSGGANPVGGTCGTRIATLTGDTYNPTLAASRDWAAVIVALDEIAAGGDATATPSTVAAVASIPGPTVLAAATVAVAVVAALAAVPAPTVAAAAIATPSSVAAVASIPAPSVAATAVVAPSTVAAVSTVPAPSVLAGAIATPSTAAAVAAAPAPTIAAGAIVSPSTVAAVGAVPTPTIIATGFDAVTAPATVAAVAAIPAPTVTAAAGVTPATIAGVVAIPAPSVSGTAITAPATVAATAAVPAPSIRADAQASPATVAATSTVPAPSMEATAVVSPATVSAVGAVPAPTVLVADPDATATPATVAAVASVPTPSIIATHDAGTTATPAGSPYAGWQPWWEPIPPLANRRR